MTHKKDDEPEPHKGHTAHHATHPKAAHKPHGKSYTVTCQDGTEATLSLSKTGSGEYPSVEAVQRWFNDSGDRRDGKCVICGCAVCVVTEA